MDRFDYAPSDGIMDSNVATVTIKVDAGIPIAGMADLEAGADSSLMLIPAGGAAGQGYSNLLGSGHAQNVDFAQFQVLSQPQIGHLVAGPLDDPTRRETARSGTSRRPASPASTASPTASAPTCRPPAASAG